MKIIKVSQTNDREAWLQLRKGKIGGSDAKKVKPLTRGADRTPAGFWHLLAENLAIQKDGEPEQDRGNRLENEALERTAKMLKIKLELDAGMWVSDVNDNISVSPDSAEPGDKPTYAAEAKCLDSHNHLQFIVQDRRLLKNDDYNPIDSLKCGTNDFRDQVVQYFVVNEDLQRLYFTLYDDRIVLHHLMHYVITVYRQQVEQLIENQLAYEVETLQAVKDLIKELRDE